VLDVTILMKRNHRYIVDSDVLFSSRIVRLCAKKIRLALRKKVQFGGNIYCTVSLAVLVVVPYVPEIVAELPCTGLVVTVNVTLLLPAGIVAEEGTCATLVLLLFSETSAPAGGAAPFRVKVPVEEAPPVTVLGFRVSAINAAGFTVKFVVFVTPYTAVSVTEV